MGEPLQISITTLAPKIADIESFDQKSNRFYEDEPPPPTAKGELFEFNPNNLSIENWIKLGLTKKQALGIKKYEAKGGQFRTIADVKKMYAINDAMFLRIQPYIKIPETEFKQQYTSNSYPEKKTFADTKSVSVEINSADSVTLTTVRGIGASFASRILKYRNRLGGFVAVSQLKEVFGIDSAKFEQIKSQINVNVLAVKKININNCKAEELNNFPYLKYKQANAIIAYRTQHGSFSKAGDLNKIAILTPEIIQKIAPYLRFE